MGPYPKERYGKWAGNPNGHKYDPSRCAMEVWPRGQFTSRQCDKKPNDGIFCKVHAKQERKYIYDELKRLRLRIGSLEDQTDPT